MRETSDESACCCGRGFNTPTGKPHYCMRHMRWSDAPVPAEPPPNLDGIAWAKGYNDWRHGVSAPTHVIATLFGYPFDVDRWLVQLGDQWYDANVLRMFAQIMDDTKVVYDEDANVPQLHMSDDRWGH